MTTKELSQLSALHYLVDKHGKEEAFGKINKKLQKTNSDYKLEKLKRGVAVFRDKEGNSVMNLKGTDIRNHKDIISDIKLGLGLSKYDKQFQTRGKQIDNYLNTEQKGSVILTGHSLGSSIITQHLAKSPSALAKIKSAELFNTGYTIPFHNSLSPSIEKEHRKNLKKKITHHHIKGDILSHQLNEKAIGSVEVYDTDKGNKHSLSQFSEL